MRTHTGSTPHLVDVHLLVLILIICVGAMRVSDLDVLLSEKAAAEIHHKWMDTLKVYNLTVSSSSPQSNLVSYSNFSPIPTCIYVLFLPQSNLVFQLHSYSYMYIYMSYSFLSPILYSSFSPIPTCIYVLFLSSVLFLCPIFHPQSGIYSNLILIPASYSSFSPIPISYSTLTPIPTSYSSLSCPILVSLSTICPVPVSYSSLSPIPVSYSSLNPIPNAIWTKGWFSI